MQVAIVPLYAFFASFVISQAPPDLHIVAVAGPVPVHLAQHDYISLRTPALSYSYNSDDNVFSIYTASDKC